MTDNVRDHIDRYRRSILQTAAASFGLFGSMGVPESLYSVDKDRQVQLMSKTGEGMIGSDLVVYQENGNSHVLQRGHDGAVFTGSAGAAIQYAVDAGETTGSGAVIELRSGTYEIERPVALAPSIWLTGSGSATTLRAAPGLNKDLLTVPAGSDHARISNLRISGNRSENERGNALVVEGGTWRPVIEHLIIRDAADSGLRFERGPNEEYSYEPTLTDIDVARCAGDGFVFGHTGDLFGANLYAEAPEGCGFTMADAGGTLVHPHAHDVRGKAGIQILESAKDLNLMGPHSEGNRQHGILIEGQRIMIRDAFIANNSLDSPGTYSGVVLDGGCNSTISNSSLINDTDRDQTQGHGLVETAECSNNRITFNLFQNNVVSAIDRSPSTGSVYRQNLGYRRRNGGKATVSNGDAIPHGLNEQPQQFWVESTEAGTYAHTINVDQTNLYVEVVQVQTGQPLMSDADVRWSAASC